MWSLYGALVVCAGIACLLSTVGASPSPGCATGPVTVDAMTYGTPCEAFRAADTKPPRTEIHRRPPAVIKTSGRVRRVVVYFGANEPGANFRCRLDRRPFRPCTSPRVYFLTSGRRHIIHIRAIDAAGNRDRTPALVRVDVRRRR